MLPTLVALALLAASTPASAPAGTAPPPARTVAGRIAAVDPAAGRLTLEVSDGPVAVSWDRNTMVLLEGRTGTPRDLVAGLPARAALAPGGRAFWIELRPRGVVPTPARGEGP